MLPTLFYETHPRDRIVGACLKSGVARTEVLGYWITFRHKGGLPCIRGILRFAGFFRLACLFRPVLFSWIHLGPIRA